MTEPLLYRDGSPVRVVDLHVHVQPWDELLPPVAAAMKSSRKDLADIERYIEEPSEFLSFLDTQGVARAALINYPSQDLMGFGASVNDYCAAYRNRAASRIIAFGGMHPRFVVGVEAAEMEMTRLLDDLKLDGIKVHPPHQLIHANGYIDGGLDSLRVLYARCEAMGVPVMIHSGTSVFPQARGKYGDPMDIDDVAVDFPKLRILLAHGGRPIWMETAFHLARRHRGVHLELSGIPPKNLLEYFPKLESIADKCAFGTDWPSPGVRSIRENVEAFLALPLADDAKRRILSGTADLLFPPR